MLDKYKMAERLEELLNSAEERLFTRKESSNNGR